MRFFAALIFAPLLACSIGSPFLAGQELGIEEAAEVAPFVLVLPSWTAEDLEALASGDLVPGSSLMGEIALEYLESDQEEPIELDPAVRDLPDEPEEEVWSPTIAPQFLAPYFHDMPRSFLTDPQHLLTTQEFRDREGFLNYHARDTELDLYVYLFDSQQEIPPSESIQGVVRSHIDQDKSVAVVFYFLGKPEKSQLAFSEKVREAVSREEREKVLRMAIEEAMEKSDPSSQLESFSIQLSIRLYWLEKVVARDGGLAGSGRLFVFPENPLAEKEKLSFWAGLKEKPVVFYSLLIAGLAFLLIILGSFGRWLSRRNRVYVFPDAEGNLLLEAPHAPGVGGVISFSSATTPPSSQKHDHLDYL